MDPTLLGVCLLTGLFAAGAVFVNLKNYDAGLQFVENDIAERLRSLRITTPRLRIYIQFWLILMVGVFLGMWVGFDLPIIGLLLALFMAAAPWYLIRRMAEDRKSKIEDQLADAMVMFSGGVRAGLSLPQSLELLSTDCPHPINQEFQQVVGEYKLGKPLEKTLGEAKDRLKSENFVLFAAALLASRESGGRLNETVERISKSVLELQRLERKIVSETAQARKSALYMAIAPVFILIAYAWLDPENVELLFNTLPGQLVLAASILFNVVAYVWALRILNADI